MVIYKSGHVSHHIRNEWLYTSQSMSVTIYLTNGYLQVRTCQSPYTKPMVINKSEPVCHHILNQWICTRQSLPYILTSNTYLWIANQLVYCTRTSWNYSLGLTQIIRTSNRLSIWYDFDATADFLIATFSYFVAQTLGTTICM